MRSTSGALVRLLAIGLMLAVAMFAAPAARAQVDQGRALAALEALRELLVAVEAAQSSELAPRLTDPDHRGNFDTALDESIAATGAERAAGLSLLFEMQREAGVLIRAYLLMGIKARSLSSDLSGEKAAQNFLVFLPEMARLYDFRVRLGAVISSSAAAMESVSGDNVVSSALAAISGEQEKVLLSAIAVASDPQIAPQWRGARVLVLKQASIGYTPLLGRKKSQELADRVLAAAIAEQDLAVASLMKDFALTLLR